MLLISAVTSTGLQVVGDPITWPQAVQNIGITIALVFAFYAFCKYS